MSMPIGLRVLLVMASAVLHCFASPPLLASPVDETGGYVGQYDPKKKSVVVFVHGVLGDHQETWTSANGVYWPELVRSDLTYRDSNIYVHRYASPKLESAQSIEELAARFGDFLETDKVLQHEKLYFVSHSMGGLVTRAWLVQRRLPPKKIAMLYFFGTPSGGANLAAIGALASRNRQFENMRPFGPGSYVEQLAMKWLATVNDRKTAYPINVWSFCAYEKKPYFGQIVVPELSAVYLCNTVPRAVAEDHVSMVKPTSLRSDAHVFLTTAYRFAAGAAAGQVLAALNSMPSDGYLGKLMMYGSDVPLDLRTQTVKLDSVEVECADEASATKNLTPPTSKGEFVVAAFAQASATGNLGAWNVAAAPTDKGKVLFKYDVKGSDSKSKCVGKGLANFSVKYLIADQK